jgi:beta-glucanase (GH16 family)
MRLHSSFWFLAIMLALSAATTGCKKSTTPPPPPDTPTVPETLRVAPPIKADATCNFDRAETALQDSGWALVFSDDFTVDNDTSRWKVWTGGAYNNELQYYSPANLRVSNGRLAITARKETLTGNTTPYDATQKTFQYTSGRIECRTDVSASTATPKVRMAARILLPYGYGLWPAFWSYGDPWPTQGEIDILEVRGQEPTKYQTNYFYGRTAGRNLVRNATGYITADEDLSQCYHVYELVWAQNVLTSYLDGKKIEEKTTGGYIPDMFGKKQRLTLNLAVGGAFFSNLDPAKIQTGTLYVDWVRVYTAK